MNEAELKKFVGSRLNEGVSLNQIQKMLAEEYDTRMTFLELRLLAAEIEDVDWSRQDPEEKPEEKKSEPQAAAPAGDGKISVEISKIARPGAVMNGTVTFPSGVSGEWLLDQMGRPDFDKLTGEPTQDDMRAFVQELQRKLSGGAR